MSSRQAAVRLELALLGFFQPDGYTDKRHCDFGSYLRLRIRPATEALIHTELQLKSLEKILIARRARSSYETCFVISFLINHKTGNANRRCFPD